MGNDRTRWPMTVGVRGVCLGLAVAGSLWWSGVARAADAQVAQPDASGFRERTGQDPWQASLGVRTALIHDAGFDAFSSNDTLLMTSLAVTRSFDLAARDFVIAVGAAADLGYASATTRGTQAELGVARGAIVLEPRYAPTPGFFVAGRLAPGVQRLSASVQDPSAPATLATTVVTPSLDVGAAAGARLNPAAVRLGIWLVADGGYTWAPSRDLTLKPELGARDAAKAGALALGGLAASGPFLRVGLALSY